MPRRVHELAKEWGVEPKELTARLEKIGLRNRRAQSTLTDDEVVRASNELGLGDKPQITIGGERMVTAETGQQVVERRVGTKVIRRRAAAPSASDTGEMEPLEPISVQSDSLQPFGAPEPMPEPFEVPPPPPPLPEKTPELSVEAEVRVEAPAVERVAAPPPVEPPPVVRAAPIAPAAAHAAPVKQEASAERPFGPQRARAHRSEEGRGGARSPPVRAQRRLKRRAAAARRPPRHRRSRHRRTPTAERSARRRNAA